MIILEQNFKWHLEAFASELYWDLLKMAFNSVIKFLVFLKITVTLSGH